MQIERLCLQLKSRGSPHENSSSLAPIPGYLKSEPPEREMMRDKLDNLKANRIQGATSKPFYEAKTFSAFLDLLI